MIMDMSAAMRLKAPNRVSHTCEAGAPECCRLRPSARRHPLKGSRSGSPRATVSNALLIAALSLWFAGCTVVQPDTTARTTLPPPVETGSAPTAASVPKQPEAPSKPAPPVPQPPQRVCEPKPPPATATKGAEKLVVSNHPLPVRAREKTPVKAEPVEPKAPIIADSGAITDAPVTELIFKGPPPQVRTGLSAKKLLMWIGLGLAIGSLAVVVRLCLIRRAEPIKVADDKNDDLMPAAGLLFKESVPLPSEALAAGKP